METAGIGGGGGSVFDEFLLPLCLLMSYFPFLLTSTSPFVPPIFLSYLYFVFPFLPYFPFPFPLTYHLLPFSFPFLLTSTSHFLAFLLHFPPSPLPAYYLHPQFVWIKYGSSPPPPPFSELLHLSAKFLSTSVAILLGDSQWLREKIRSCQIVLVTREKLPSREDFYESASLQF